MKPPILLFLLLSLLAAAAQNQPDTQRLYCNLSIRYEVNPRFGRRYKTTVEGLVTGTCWAANVNGQPVIFTAAHVLACGPNFTPQSLERAELISLEIKPIIGLLGYEIQEVGFSKGNPDWVALRPKDVRAFKGSQLKELSMLAPKVGDSMTVIGFPDTAHEQRTERTVTSISPNGEFIVFNQPLDPGYSGGVVLNGQHEAVGVVVTTDHKQSNALVLSADMLKGVSWKRFEEIREQTFAQ